MPVGKQQIAMSSEVRETLSGAADRRGIPFRSLHVLSAEQVLARGGRFYWSVTYEDEKSRKLGGRPLRAICFLHIDANRLPIEHKRILLDMAESGAGSGRLVQEGGRETIVFQNQVSPEIFLNDPNCGEQVVANVFAKYYRQELRRLAALDTTAVREEDCAAASNRGVGPLRRFAEKMGINRTRRVAETLEP